MMCTCERSPQSSRPRARPRTHRGRGLLPPGSAWMAGRSVWGFFWSQRSRGASFARPNEMLQEISLLCRPQCKRAVHCNCWHILALHRWNSPSRKTAWSGVRGPGMRCGHPTRTPPRQAPRSASLEQAADSSEIVGVLGPWQHCYKNYAILYSDVETLDGIEPSAQFFTS